VNSVIVELKEYQSFSSVRYQTGIKNKTNFKLLKNENGTLITEENVFSLSLKSFNLGSLFSWLLLGTGVLMKFLPDSEDDLIWFKRMEDEVAESLLVDS